VNRSRIARCHTRRRGARNENAITNVVFHCDIRWHRRAGAAMKKVLVGLDGSPRADGVLAYAKSLARVTGAKIVLFRSFGIPSEMTLAWPVSDQPLELALRTQAQQYLDTCARNVPSELFGGSRVDVGVPVAGCVCRRGRRERGSHRHRLARLQRNRSSDWNDGSEDRESRRPPRSRRTAACARALMAQASAPR
jgi:hypothetical protein